MLEALHCLVAVLDVVMDLIALFLFVCFASVIVYKILYDWL
jgi:hypothetical protein